LRGDKNSYRQFQFDVLLANPPFAGHSKEPRMVSKYQLALKADVPVGRDILFIERNLDFLKPGGRMAVVLPQGRFNNSSDKRIREFIAERCRILAVVGLHGNTFKPHTGTKTSVLFVQKWNDDKQSDSYCPRVDDYNIFFATQRQPGKDTSGEKIYATEKHVRYFDDDRPGAAPVEYTASDFVAKYGSFKSASLFKVFLNNGQQTVLNLEEIEAQYGGLAELERTHAHQVINLKQPVLEVRRWLDDYQHPIVEHDLFNTDGRTQGGIAEAFIEFAKKEKLSFFR
jgi:type I restriction enzyme M protein